MTSITTSTGRTSLRRGAAGVATAAILTIGLGGLAACSDEDGDGAVTDEEFGEIDQELEDLSDDVQEEVDEITDEVDE